MTRKNVAGKVTGVYMTIIKRQPGTDKIPSCADCSPARQWGGGDAPRRYLDDSRADNEHISSIPKVTGLGFRLCKCLPCECNRDIQSDALFTFRKE